MTYCKQQIPDDFYVVDPLQKPIELKENLEYIKVLKDKQKLHELYHKRILELEKLKDV